MIIRWLTLCFCLALLACAGSPPTATDSPGVATTSTVTYRDVSPAEFAKLTAQPQALILDVRTPAETANGVIDGAVLLDYRSPDFSRKLAQLDTGRTFLVYCASGGRSARVCEQLQDAGVTEVYNLKGGYRAWTAGPE